jgi:hypothetical protein
MHYPEPCAGRAAAADFQASAGRPRRRRLLVGAPPKFKQSTIFCIVYPF